jgi:hypothetical protein
LKNWQNHIIAAVPYDVWWCVIWKRILTPYHMGSDLNVNGTAFSLLPLAVCSPANAKTGAGGCMAQTRALRHMIRCLLFFLSFCFFTGLRCMKLLVSSLNMRRTWNRHRTWQWHVRRFYYPNHAPNLVLTCFREFRNFITTFLINLFVRKLPREHSRRSAVAACSSTQLGWR